MKDLKQIINESKYSELWTEVQNEVTKTGEYHTYDYSEGKKKFKKGFIIFNEDQQFVSINGYNKFEEFADLLGVEAEEYKQNDSINIGECINIEQAQILRIW